MTRIRHMSSALRAVGAVHMEGLHWRPRRASTVSVKVKLKYDPVVPVIVTAPTFRWTKGDFRLGDNQIFVSEIFQIGTETHPEEADEIGALIGGEARVGGKKIDGTFSFKAGTPKWFSAAGTYNVTVVFTPSDTVRYAPAECTIPIEVVKRTLLSIEPSTDITNKEVGTEFDALWLPPFVNCRTEDGSFYSGIGVTWDKTSYDLNSTAERPLPARSTRRYSDYSAARPGVKGHGQGQAYSPRLERLDARQQRYPQPRLRQKQQS